MAKVRIDSDSFHVFKCPGCGHEHEVAVSKPFRNGCQWVFKGTMERPTFEPSLDIKWGKLADPDWQEPTGEDAGSNWSGRCHSIITDGMIDSTHHLANQKVELPDYE
jgi:hypothetical protein